MPQPLLHIGYHKTGSTWLQNHLFVREDAGFVVPFDRKTTLNRAIVEPYPLTFDAAAARAALRPDVEAAIEQGKVPVITSEALCGGDTSGGYQSKELADRLHAVFPDGKVLIIIREQRSMILSSYSMYLRGGGLLRLKDYLDLPRFPHAIPFFSLEFFEYDHLIAYYQNLFGPERVLVLPYEMFAREPDRFAGEILRFSGAKEITGLPFDARPKKMWPAFSVALRRYMNPFFDRVVQNGYSWMCPDVRMRYVSNWFFWRVVNPNAPEGLSQRIETGWKARIAARVRGIYAKSNRRTAGLIGRDLSTYGYDV